MKLISPPTFMNFAHRVVRNPTIPSLCRTLRTSPPSPATPFPITAHGPPPCPPTPAPSQHEERLERRRKQAALLQQSQAIRANSKTKSSPLRKRFWKEVYTKEIPGEGIQVFLDSRPVRTPSKEILTIPPTKPQLASAIALEWDLLVSAQQALKQHLIPLTSLTCRADDIRLQDTKGATKTRDEIVKMVMRYLDTDTLLCWAPERSASDQAHLEEQGEEKESLRQMQIRIAQPIIGYLTTHIWPGVEIKPVLDSNNIMPTPQSQPTKDVIRGWVSGLPAYELAALERGVLAGKSFLVAVRLLVEWSEEFQHLSKNTEIFGVEEAAEASSLEVRWQTGMWGEVEDTHDVDKEDLRRQLGSVVLLVSGQVHVQLHEFIDDEDEDDDDDANFANGTCAEQGAYIIVRMTRS
ncbi:MAG: ATP synthase complex assembly protein atp12 [Cirrosporium novae-zelandiae]|nr:MAG: ATP synthase complex assembly protein atp12 [Cirrosporium novae-zelandiae]